MALRLLKGPVEIFNAGGGTAPSYVAKVQWYNNVGLLATLTVPNMSGRGVIAIDGGSLPINQSSEAYSYGWYADVERPLIAVNGMDGSREYTLEPHALVAEPVQDDPFSAEYWYYQYVRIGNERYRSLSSVIYRWTGTEWEVCSEDLGLGGAFIGQGRHKYEIFVAQSINGDTTCKFWNALTGEISRAYHLGMTCLGVAYAPELGVFVSLHGSPYSLRFWSMETMPTSVSVPAVYTGAVRAGRVATFRTRALGAQNDPCTEEVVEWAVIGAGTLITPTSVTDEDGYAEARVLYPLTATGDSTIQASLRC